MADDQFSGVINDQRFQGLSPDQQRQVLFGITNDSRFKGMSDDDTAKFIAGVKSSAPQASAPNPYQQAAERFVDPGKTSMSAGTKTFAQAHPDQSQTASQRFIRSAGMPTSANEATGMLQNILSPQASPTSPGFGQTLPIVGPLFRAQRELWDNPDPQASIRKFIPVLGPIAYNMQKQIDKGDYAGASGSGVNLLAQILGGKGAMEKPLAQTIRAKAAAPGLMDEALARAPQPKTITTGTAAANIRDAVNPLPKTAKAFEKNVADNLDYARDAARRGGFDIKSRDTLANAFKMAGDEARAMYYDQILGPVKDTEVPTTGIKGYEGGSSSPNFAKLSQLDARLSEINAEMRGAYEKGGVAARAAVKSKGELTSEAAQIRNVLYREIATRRGFDPDYVGQMRARFGQMDDIADKVTQSINRNRFNENAAKQGEKVPHTVAEAAFRAANTAKRKVLGHPADRVISKTISRMDEAPQQTPVQANPPAPPVPRGPSAAREALRTTEMNAPSPAQTPASAPAIPATEPGLLRPGGGAAQPASSPLPWGPEGNQPALMRTPVRPTVGQENPEISPLSLGDIQEKTLRAGAMERFLQSAKTHGKVNPSVFLNAVGEAKGADMTTVGKYQQVLRRGVIDPVKITLDKKGNIIDADGRHRALAAVREGISRIPIIVERTK